MAVQIQRAELQVPTGARLPPAPPATLPPTPVRGGGEKGGSAATPRACSGRVWAIVKGEAWPGVPRGPRRPGAVLLRLRSHAPAVALDCVVLGGAVPPVQAGSGVPPKVRRSFRVHGRMRSPSGQRMFPVVHFAGVKPWSGTSPLQTFPGNNQHSMAMTALGLEISLLISPLTTAG